MVSRASATLRRIGRCRAEWVGFGRWLSNKRVTVPKMIAHARTATSERAGGLHVLAIQDTTELNFQAHAGQVSGLGPVGNGKDVGFFLHPVIAVDADSRAVLGLVGAKMWSRRGKRRGDYRKQPIEKKESYRWLEGGEQAQAVLAGARMVTTITDREGDIYEAWARLPADDHHLLIRASRDRALIGGGSLFEIAEIWRPRQRFTIDVPARRGQRARTATVELRFGKVLIARPVRCTDASAPSELCLRMIDVREINSRTKEPIHWRLLTTHTVASVADARQIIEWYRMRWHVEQLFRTVKSQGLDIEESQLTTATALQKLALVTVLAAIKIMQLVQARDGSDRPASDVADKAQIAAANALQATLEGKTDAQKNPHPTASLAWLSWTAARLGGWGGYKSERPPGPLTMRRGWQELQSIARGWALKNVCIP